MEKKATFLWINVSVFVFFLISGFLAFNIYQFRQDHKRSMSSFLEKQGYLIKQNNEKDRAIERLKKEFNYKKLNRISKLLRKMGVSKSVDPLFFQIRPGDICIDGGANDGTSSDAMAVNGAIVYAFEPNPKLVRYLNKKYKDTENIKVMPQALGSKAGHLNFALPKGGDTIGGTVSIANRTDLDVVQKVPVIRMVDFIRKEFISKGKRVYLLKLDVEGAEFDIIPDLIKSGVYQHIDYILYEPHERLFSEGKEKRQYIENLIKQYKVTNIYPNWP